MESYSCKMAGDCKRLYKHMHDEKTGSSPHDLQLLGPSASLVSGSPSSLTMPSALLQFGKSFGDDLNADFGEHIVSKKTLFYLISTLNASFHPDYDFTNTPSSEFGKEPTLETVVKEVENYLGTLDAYASIKHQLWPAIDKEINLSECEFYR